MFTVRMTVTQILYKVEIPMRDQVRSVGSGGTSRRQGAAGGRPKHVSLVSKLPSDQGHSTFGANITNLQSFPSNLLSSAPGVRREILGWQGREQKGEQTPWGLLTQKDTGRSSYPLCVFEPIASPVHTHFLTY